MMIPYQTANMFAMAIWDSVSQLFVCSGHSVWTMGANTDNSSEQNFLPSFLWECEMVAYKQVSKWCSCL